MGMLHIGLTGGIAAGKSAVSARLVQHGAVLVDSDAIVRELQGTAQPGLIAIAREFGPQMIAADGSLDRKALAELIFEDKDARQRLNDIIHPLVRQRSVELVQEAAAKYGDGVVIVHDIPLLVETGQSKNFDRVLVVEAPYEQRLQRMIEFRGMSAEDAAARIDSQATDQERRAVADHVFINDGPLEELERDVDQWWSDNIGPLSGVSA